MVTLVCSHCGKLFKRSRRHYNKNLKLGQRPYCSFSCQKHCQKSKTSHPCVTCGKPTMNPKFCSRSCSAKYNNKLKPKRLPEGSCFSCGTIISSTRKYCKSCKISFCSVDYSSRTLADCKTIYGSRNSYITSVREHARKIGRENDLLNSCKVCGYQRCVQCCHKKPVSHFPETATLAEVNDPTNLVGLCPTHHWELDHGFLNIE